MNITLFDLQSLSPDTQEIAGAPPTARQNFSGLLRESMPQPADTDSQVADFNRIISFGLNDIEALEQTPAGLSGANWQAYLERASISVSADSGQATGPPLVSVEVQSSAVQAHRVTGLQQANAGETLPVGGNSLPLTQATTPSQDPAPMPLTDVAGMIAAAKTASANAPGAALVPEPVVAGKQATAVEPLPATQRLPSGGGRAESTAEGTRHDLPVTREPRTGLETIVQRADLLPAKQQTRLAAEPGLSTATDRSGFQVKSATAPAIPNTVTTGAPTDKLIPPAEQTRAAAVTRLSAEDVVKPGGDEARTTPLARLKPVIDMPVDTLRRENPPLPGLKPDLSPVREVAQVRPAMQPEVIAVQEPVAAKPTVPVAGPLARYSVAELAPADSGVTRGTEALVQSPTPAGAVANSYAGVNPQAVAVNPAGGASSPLGHLPPHLEVLSPGRQADGTDWGNGLGERVNWMINQKQNSATIRLDPPALGKLDVQVRITDDATTITIQTQHAQTRDLIETASVRLRDILQDNGYQNVNVDVSQRQDQQQSRAQTTPGNAPGQGDESAHDSDSHQQQPDDEQHFVSEGLVDTFA